MTVKSIAAILFTAAISCVYTDERGHGLWKREKMDTKAGERFSPIGMLFVISYYYIETSKLKK